MSFVRWRIDFQRTHGRTLEISEFCGRVRVPVGGAVLNLRLSLHDPEVGHLFKVVADFCIDMPCTDESARSLGVMEAPLPQELL